jgi:hypothetical protein
MAVAAVALFFLPTCQWDEQHSLQPPELVTTIPRVLIENLVYDATGTLQSSGPPTSNRRCISVELRTTNAERECTLRPESPSLSAKVAVGTFDSRSRTSSLYSSKKDART